MIWFKGLWKNIPLRVTWHFSLHSLTYIYSSKVSSRMACLFSSSNHSKLSKESDQTSGLLGQQLISLGPLKRNYMRLQCSFCPLRFSLALSPSREAEFCNPEILTLSHSPVHMFTAPAGSGMGTLSARKKGQGFKIILARDTNVPKCNAWFSAIFLAMKFCWPLLYCCYTEKSSCSPNPALAQLGPLEKYLSWQPCSHMISRAWSPCMSLTGSSPAMSKHRVPRATLGSIFSVASLRICFVT